MFSCPCPTMPVSLDDRGLTTAEYAICTLAVVAFAGLLYVILTGDAVQTALTTTIVDALGSDR